MTDNTGQTTSPTVSRLRLLGWGGAATLMVLPLIAMQFTDDVDWTGFDFAFFAGMLLAVAIPLEIVARRSISVNYVLATGVALLAAFLMVLVNGAVGIIGDESNPANLMYFAVLAIGVSGAIVTKGQPPAMVRVMLVTAMATVLVGAIAIMGGMAGGAMEVVAVSAFFVIQWIVAALLFRRSAQEGCSPLR